MKLGMVRTLSSLVLVAVSMYLFTPAMAHNKVVVIPMGEEASAEPTINMQCQDGGINQYPDCFSCEVDAAGECSLNELSACLADRDGNCLGLNLCVAECDTPACVETCRSMQPPSTIALHEAILQCSYGTGEPNMDGACGLVCPLPPQ